ncbi:putative TIM-barrel fold metal-dependent hydrolase [Mycolicibacterium sp. BK556]|uniref:amidohydrolase family protein n=1 Tax=Mycobacteriaceae TaxID=1762 RepID=UPI000D3844AA|nr:MULTISPECIES: amidohydrolase family protein [Mycobacteriaceae]MBB3606516.1 putative TIM-barrel fold metal-dependent hydrolase [Mycolicibacterium sp. BK556]MBB3636238.1 putative TIM-barrel fold metal-dependent hydrolase [Mycolicibacterium sp. BK607]MBB3753530.1 putative TIM-barrel fold metal-dependent hydrolase [Mycolicibacterium sp. BK634]TDO06381.1 putative TIM-barrel fold metal-dependent hydrolase [Mycobacterium sp. BK086]
MNVDELIIISIDDHVIEPPDMFDAHVPARYRDQAPKLLRDEKGFDTWVFEGDSVGMVGLNATVSWPKEEWGMDPSSLAEMRTGAYLVGERVRDMNRNGVLASMCFPSFVGFAGRKFMDAKDKDLGLVMLKAYNDWHIDEWCASHPGRFIPQAIGPLWNMDALVAEVHRVAAKGCRAISMPELPHLLGLPTYQNNFWDPFFTAICDEDMVMCLHIGQGLDAIDMGPDLSFDNYMVLSTQVSVLCVQDLLWGPAMRKYPGLKIAYSEGGIGWIPFLLDRVDRHYQNQRWTGQDFGGKLPSEVFREHALACFISDPTSLKLHQEIGDDIIAFETDYPHSDSLWPDAPEDLLRQCQDAGCSDELINKISWSNAARFCSYDPFAVIPKEAATVGALRGLSPDVETSVVPRREWRARFDANPPFHVAMA